MSAPAVARLSGPGEILAALPSLCGFPPTESLVLLSLRARTRVGLTVRVDLPPEPDDDAVAVRCADRLVGDGAEHVVLAVHSERGRRTELVRAVTAACLQRDIGVLEALHVAGGRWTSYTCCAACCPPTGTPVPHASPSVDLVRAEQAANGRAVLASREDLVRSVAPPSGELAAAAAQRLAEAQETWSRHRLEHGAPASRRSTLDHAQALLDRVADGVAIGPVDVALVAVGMTDVLARDGLATLMLSRDDELLSLLLQVARQVTPPHDTPVCTLLAWVAHGRGDGALTNVALERALAGSPDYGLARLLRECLDGGVRPAQVREIARGTREVLRRRDRPARRR